MNNPAPPSVFDFYYDGLRGLAYDEKNSYQLINLDWVDCDNCVVSFQEARLLLSLLIGILMLLSLSRLLYLPLRQGSRENYISHRESMLKSINYITRKLLILQLRNSQQSMNIILGDMNRKLTLLTE